MSNPRRTALISGLGVVVVGSSMLFATEGVSPLLATLQWVLLVCGVVALVVALVQMGGK